TSTISWGKLITHDELFSGDGSLQKIAIENNRGNHRIGALFNDQMLRRIMTGCPSTWFDAYGMGCGT
ncbi:MAG: hypothetical protein WBH50_12905, partial [Fuerstiella sp.]